jgi:hypothetical protein
VAGKNFPLSVEITAVDRLTAPMRKINNAIKDTFKPIRTFQAGLRSISDESGLTLMGKRAAGVAGALKGVADATMQVGVRLAALGGAAAAGLYAVVKGAADAADGFNDLSPRVGVSVKALSELAYVAKLNDLSLEGMGKGLLMLNKNMVAARTGSKEMAQWFRRAGVSLTDTRGKMKSADQVLMELSDRFAKMPDGPRKSALALGIFGRAGAELIPLLNNGSTEINRLRAEAERLGVTFDETSAAAGAKFNDSVDTLNTALMGLRNTIGSALFPVLQPIIEKLTDWLAANRELVASKVQEFVVAFTAALPKLVSAAEAVGEAIKKVAGWVEWLSDKFGGSNVAIAAFALIIGAPLIAALGSLVLAVGGLVAAFGSVAGAVIAAGAAIAAGVALIWANWDDLANKMKGAFDGVRDYLKGVLDEIVGFFTSKIQAIKDVVGGLGRYLGFGGGPTAAASPTGASAPPTGALQFADQLNRTVTNNASVRVQFDNLPQGARVSSQGKVGGGLLLDSNYAGRAMAQ